MFERNLENVKTYLDEIGARYNVVSINGFEMIYVFEKDAYDNKKKHPRKYKDLYVSYLRISKHDGDERFYTKMDGITRYLPDYRIKKIIDELTGI